MIFKKNKKTKGFTLIELMMVIALLAILSATEFISVGPLLQKTRDSVRKQTVLDLATALQSYVTSHHDFPHNLSDNTDPNFKGWISELVDNGDLKRAPDLIPYADQSFANSCDPVINNAYNQFCYNSTGPPPAAVVWIKLESDAERHKCPEAKFGKDPSAFYVWSSEDGKAGIICYASRTTSLAGFTFSEYY